MVYCTVCMNNNRTNKNKSYFNYPKDPTRRKEWLKAVGREDLLSILIDDKTRQQYRICEDHFEKCYLKFSKNRNVKYLYDSAFPTLNLPTYDTECSSSSQCENVSVQEKQNVQFTPTEEIIRTSSSNNPLHQIGLEDQTSRSIQTDPIDQSLSDCKEKWRNIRSAFLRSLKVSGNRAKRPYYLSKELNFILPYTKPHSTIQSNNDEQSDYNIFLEESENADVSNPESREYVELEIHPKITGSPLMTETKTYDHANFEPRHRSRRKRSMTEVESTFLDYIKCKKHKAAEGSSQLTQSPIQHFFQSLMPDVESMTNEQVRRFKIEVMLLIDKIKSNKMQ